MITTVVSFSINQKSNSTTNYLLGDTLFYNEFSQFNINDYLINDNKNNKELIFLKKVWKWPNYIFYITNDTIIRYKYTDTFNYKLEKAPFVILDDEGLYLINK